MNEKEYKIMMKAQKRKHELSKRFYEKNRCVLNEYVAEFFDKDIYEIPNDAVFLYVRPASIDEGTIILQVHFIGEKGKLFVAYFAILLDELELYKELKTK